MTSRQSKWLLALPLALTVACSSAIPRQSGLITTTEIQASNDQVRVYLYSLARYMGTEVARAADSVIHLNMLYPDTAQVRYRRTALRWKIQLFNQAMAILGNQDPLLAMADLWALSLQQEEFLTTGAGGNLFGPHQAVAAEAATRIAQRGNFLVGQLTDNPYVDTTESFVSAWARSHPLTRDISGRETLVPELALRLDPGGMGAFGAVGDMAQRLANISDRLAVYVNTVPQLTVWQADLLIDQTLETNPQLIAIRDSLASMSDNVGKVAGVLEYGSPLIDTVRTALREEVALLLGVAMDSVEVLRLATFGDIATERELLLAAVEAERGRIKAEVDSLAARAIDRATSGLRSLLWLAILLVLLLLMAPLGVGYLLGRMSRTSTP